MKLPLKGIIPPMVTPLSEDQTLDSKGLKNLIEHLLEGGVSGIFLLGTNGEGPSLGYALRKQLISEACNIVKNRVPILVGITDTSFGGSLQIAHHAQNAGADALVAAPSSRLARPSRLQAGWRLARLARRRPADVYHLHDPELLPVGLWLTAPLRGLAARLRGH